MGGSATAGAVLALLLSAAVAPAQAERSRDLGHFVVHYNAMQTDVLDPAVASTHAIRRARDRGILNVAVTRKQLGAKPLPVAAMVSAEVSRRDGTISALTMREIHDGGAIYYIGEFDIQSREPLRFRIMVSPESASPPYTLSFEKQFMLE